MGYQLRLKCFIGFKRSQSFKGSASHLPKGKFKTVTIKKETTVSISVPSSLLSIFIARNSTCSPLNHLKSGEFQILPVTNNCLQLSYNKPPGINLNRKHGIEAKQAKLTNYPVCCSWNTFGHWSCEKDIYHPDTIADGSCKK